MEEERWYTTEENHTLREQTENVGKADKITQKTQEKIKEEQVAIKLWRDSPYVPRKASLNSWIMLAQPVIKAIICE